MKKTFEGYHGEWNLGSPGGWEYQRMIQAIYLPAWKLLKKYTKIPVELDLETDLFKPSLLFAELMISASRKKYPERNPFIVLMAEEETLESVVENKRFVEYLNSLDNISAKLIGPRELKLRDGKLFVDDREPTVMFMDFNTSVLVGLEKKHSIAPIIEAIKRNIVVNPRGMESINVKEIFEPVSMKNSPVAKQLSATTIERTPWTRVFYHRKTTGPDGNMVDLVAWARANPERWVLKPGSGWSGIGIFVGPKLKTKKEVNSAIKKSLDPKHHGSYIIQEFVPTTLWSEYKPDLDHRRRQIDIVEKQTDFRCLMSNRGLVGFLARYGGIPTNVGSGGGVQALGIVTSKHTPGEAAHIINEALKKLSFTRVKKIRKTIDDGALAYDFKYLKGPIPIALRPRIIDPGHVKALKKYAENLYKDTIKLEKMWFAGKLGKYTKVSPREKQIIKLQPRTEDSIAMMASDGLFNFGAGLFGHGLDVNRYNRQVSKDKRAKLSTREKKYLLYTLNSMMLEHIHNELDYYDKFTPENYAEEKNKFFKAVKNVIKYNPQFTYQDDITPTEKYSSIKNELERLKGNDRIIGEFIKTYSDVADLLLAWRKNDYESVTRLSGKLFGSYQSVNAREIINIYNDLRGGYVAESSAVLNANQAGKIFSAELRKDGLTEWRVIIQDNLASEILIYEARKTIAIKSDALMTREKLTRFMHHEIKGHAYQTLNALTADEKYRDWFLNYIGTERQYQGLALFTIINNLSLKHTADTIARYLLFMYANSIAASKPFYDVYREIYKVTDNRNFAWLAALRSKRGWRDTSRPGCFQKDNAYIFGCLEIIKLIRKDKNNYDKLMQGIFPLVALPYIGKKTIKRRGVDRFNTDVIEYMNGLAKRIKNNNDKK